MPYCTSATQFVTALSTYANGSLSVGPEWLSDARHTGNWLLVLFGFGDNGKFVA